MTSGGNHQQGRSLGCVFQHRRCVALDDTTIDMQIWVFLPLLSDQSNPAFVLRSSPVRNQARLGPDSD